MSVTAKIKLVVLFDNELRDLARAFGKFNESIQGPESDNRAEYFKAVYQVGMNALAHLIKDPDAAFVVLGSRGTIRGS